MKSIIKNIVKKYFLWIFERVRSVRKAVAQMIKDSRSISKANRMPYWMRRGYVEEVCSFAP